MNLLDWNNGLSRATALVLLAATVLAVVHHTDHVLRVDHSGWPFRAVVTPFTFSLVAYVDGLRRRSSPPTSPRP